MSRQSELAQLGRVFDGSALSNRNWLINGDFSVWQRGLFHITDGYGSVDRWSQHFNGTQILSRHEMTQTRANEIKAACGHVPNYFVSYVVQSFGTYSGFRTRIEDIMRASGQTVTFSVVAASENGSVLQPRIRIWNTSAGASQDILANAVTTNSVMNRYEFTVTFADVFTVGATPDGTGFIEVELYTDRVGWHDYACFQLELGDTATPFEHRSIGQELQACRRFYQQYQQKYRNAVYFSLANFFVFDRQEFDTTMRAAPTCTWNSGGMYLAINGQNTASATMYAGSSSYGFSGATITGATFVITRQAGGVTPSNCLVYNTEVTDAIFAFDAEL